MEYFWYTYHTLPDGVGFSHFDHKHLTAIALTALGIVICCLIFKHLGEHGQEIMLKVTALSVGAGELARDIFLVCVGRMGMEYLPLHLCSMAIYIYILHAFLKPCRFRDALGEISYSLLMPGSMCAILFPSWTAYPMLTFMNLHSFIWHALLVLYPVLLLLSHRIHPVARHWYYPVIFLCIITPPIYLFDVATGYNYLFVNYPLAGTPLMWLYNVMGKWWRVGYALGIFGIIMLMLGIAELSYRGSNWMKKKKAAS